MLDPLQHLCSGVHPLGAALLKPVAQVHWGPYNVETENDRSKLDTFLVHSSPPSSPLTLKNWKSKGPLFVYAEGA